jgi:hypothetical protein
VIVLRQPVEGDAEEERLASLIKVWLCDEIGREDVVVIVTHTDAEVIGPDCED